MTDPELAKLGEAIRTPGMIGLAVGAMALIIQERGGWRVWVRGLLAAVVVAVLLGLGLKETSVAPSMQLAIIGLCAYTAPDLLGAIGLVGSMIRTDPFGLVQKLRAAIRGDKNAG